MPNFVEKYNSELQMTLSGELFNKPNVMLLRLNEIDGSLFHDIFEKQLEKLSDEEIAGFLHSEIERVKSSDVVDESLKKESDQAVKDVVGKDVHTGKASQLKSLYNSTVDVFSGAQSKEDIAISNLIRFDASNTDFDFFEAEQNNIPINLIAFRQALDADNITESLRKAIDYVDDNALKSSRIHCVWVDCAKCSSSDMENICAIASVFSSSINLKSRILILTPNPDEISAELDSSHTIDAKACRVEGAIDATMQLYTKDDATDSFRRSKEYELDIMQNYAKRIVVTFGASSGAIGLTPIPVADAALLAPLQILMIKRIVDNYKMEGIIKLSGAVIIDVFLTSLGKSAATSLAKFIPVAGTAAGAIAGGTVATTFTLAIGYVLSEICSECCETTIRGEEIDFSKLLTPEELKRRTSEKFKSLMSKNKEKNAQDDEAQDSNKKKAIVNPISAIKSKFSSEKTVSETSFETVSENEILCECGAKLKQEAKFCSNCGKPVETNRTCSCGAELKSGMKFCSNCGNPAQA